ncbi:DsbA family protein [Patescibacteria group bacterium]|nr:DsbA family protein [Patescibacteria group bacterium]
MNKFKENPLFSLAVVIVFFALGLTLGGMYVKIQYLEGKVAGVNTGTNNAPTAPSAPAAPSQPSGPTKVNVNVTGNDPVKGNPNAKLTIVEFADYQCPYCARFQTDTLPQIIKDYVDTGKVKFVFKNLAFLGKESTDAANAALCAKEQNKFWEYHDKLFSSQSGENQGGFAIDKLKGFAASLGLNTSQFNDCLDKQKYNAQVTADQAEASKNGFQSTPSLAVGTTPVIGAQPYSQFKTLIDAELAK